MKVLTGILIFMMMLTGSFIETEAHAWWVFDDITFRVQDQEIDMTYSSNNTTYTYYLSYDFYQTTSGLAVYDYDGSGPLGNGTLPDGHYRIASGVNAAYRYLYIGNLEFDVYSYYYEFELIKGTNSIQIYWESNGTNDPRYENTSGNDVDVAVSGIDLDDWYLVIYNSLYDSVVAYEGAYGNGYGSGYEQGKEDYAYDDNGNYVDAATWGQQQYQNGLSQGESNSLAIQNMIPGILGVMIAFFLQLASISVLGVTILDLIVLMFGLSIVLLLFRTLVK